MAAELSLTTAEIIAILLVVVLVPSGSVLAYRAWKNSRITPEERERRRRALLVAQGKMGDAMVVEFRGELLFYTYDVRGVQYTASQDLTPLVAYVPKDMSVVVGPISVRYDAKNPANSIVLAEEWSGLRAANQPRA
ncbi:MAG TPA: hypothetical protein VLY24_22530 [Bryobacteraceae bacterium]|nr:hypothetical protein [Bryobacteraceae bacterium]